MSYFGAVRAALAKKRAVCCPRFVHFAFDSEHVRIWDGVGNIDLDGEHWKGLGTLISISDAPFGSNDAAGNVTYSLSGVNADIIAAAQSQVDEVRGRPVTLTGRFLDAETLESLDSPFIIRSDVMDRMEYSGSGPSQRSVSLICETIWTNRNAAAFAYFSPRDQEARFPGDRGLDFVQALRPGVKRTWPILDDPA